MSLFAISSLGKPTIPSPLSLPQKKDFVKDEKRLLLDPEANIQDLSRRPDAANWLSDSFELAGPRELLFFSPANVRAAIVTCGGLCPGINAVIRGLVMQLWHRYGVRQIVGVRYGYQGLAQQSPHEFLTLTPDDVESIHEQGGTILGSSRGTPPTEEMLETLIHHKINMLFTIGGDGTMRGALNLAQAAEKRKLPISIIGLPKTIDNDIPYVKRSFGFETAVAIACESLLAAHVEAVGAHRGIGLVRLMGRHSGYITATAALASSHPNFCLVPEVPWRLEGQGGLLELIERRLDTRGHVLIVSAEGAGQEYFAGKPEDRDLSGNIKLGDIGIYLRERILAHFIKKGERVPLRYIDPSYLIRAAPANPGDVLFCGRLAQNAVHAAMAGKTALLIGYWHGVMTHVPMAAAANGRQTINPQGELWFNVSETTGQPSRIGV